MWQWIAIALAVILVMICLLIVYCRYCYNKLKKNLEKKTSRDEFPGQVVKSVDCEALNVPLKSCTGKQELDEEPAKKSEKVNQIEGKPDDGEQKEAVKSEGIGKEITRKIEDKNELEVRVKKPVSLIKPKIKAINAKEQPKVVVIDLMEELKSENRSTVGERKIESVAKFFRKYTKIDKPKDKH